ncbi:MAG TPA: LytTR family DNA-binding domain-containing protein [Ohtaekwangia sp.]|nr:LytTR family DNA-binding domain-containing protein [Ohtaekwangia sp.]
MNILIIEDELPARAKLESMLSDIDSGLIVVGKLGSVRDTLQWLKENHPPDLAFVDVQLSDDHSFEIFKHHPCDFPVIFTTAYDRYLLESFELNTIDYLLKPFSLEKLRRSLEKVKRFQQHFGRENILKLVSGTTRQRIVGKKGTEFMAIDINDIAYCYTEHKIVFARDFNGRQLIIDKSLGELEASLDPEIFFRLNRKFIANVKAIDRFKSVQGKIRIYLKPETKEDVHVSKETAPGFRRWIAAQ